MNGTTYSRLVHDMKQANIALNRKMLADLAVRDPQAFTAVVVKAQAG
jgi:large subunit ribosomal protein L20